MTIIADSKSPETQEDSFITEDFLKSVNDNPDRINDLSSEQQQEFHSYLMDETEGDNPTPEPVEETAPEAEPETTPDPEPEKEPEQSDKPSEQEPVAVKKELEKERLETQRLADELNKVRQKKNSFEKALEKDSKAFAELKDKKYDVKDDDIYDQTALKEMMIRNQRMEDELAVLKTQQLNQNQAGIDAAARLEADLQQRKIFSEVDELQKSFPQLATKVSFEKLNSQWGSYLDTIVTLSETTADSLGLTDEQKADPSAVKQILRDNAYAKYEADPVLQESAKKYMSADLQDESNLNNYFRILDVDQAKRANGGNLRMNFLEQQAENGQLEKLIADTRQKAAIQASNAAAGAIENNSPTPLTSSDGPAESPSGGAAAQLTTATATQRLDILQSIQESGGTWTPEHKQEMEQIIGFLEGQKRE